MASILTQVKNENIYTCSTSFIKDLLFKNIRNYLSHVFSPCEEKKKGRLQKLLMKTIIFIKMLHISGIVGPSSGTPG